MKKALQINSILIFSEKNNKYFFSEFREKLNVIYGKNTGGKSTLIQLILFAFGINDNNSKLIEILSEEIFVRLDCTLTGDNGKRYFTFVRQDETLLIQEDFKKITRYNGISGDNSVEHIKLKKYFSQLFDFSLMLESNSGISLAPLETIFLPYYVSQEVGWVYLRKSFSNLNFYKNFKEDFLDYYLGIENVIDREKKREIESEIGRLQQQVKFYLQIENGSDDLTIANIVNSSLDGKANELIANISKNKNQLLDLEKNYVDISNKLTFHIQRLSVISKVKRNHNHQEPGKDNCPTCTQVLPTNIENVYAFFQEENDTITLESSLKKDIKQLQSLLNSYDKKIQAGRSELHKASKIFNRYSENELTLESYIESKANSKLYENVLTQIGQLSAKLLTEKDKLKDYKTEDEIISERNKFSKIFKKKYASFNAELGLPTLKDDRFYSLYDISTFPFQGVELHRAVLSYHFAFNHLLTENQNIHRLPFILDSVFKEDVDGGNKAKILEFISKNFPPDTQTILSIADDKNKDSKIDEYKTKIFKEKGHLICIGNNTDEKALLKENDGSQSQIIKDTYRILETT